MGRTAPRNHCTHPPSPSQEAEEARIARESARVRSDWYSLLQAHQDELPALFDGLTSVAHQGAPEGGAGGASDAGDSSDDLVSIEEMRAVFNAKGDAWGFIGVGGMRMGTTMMLDLRIGSHGPAAHVRPTATSSASISRSVMNDAVADFAHRRTTGHRRLRVASWYVAHAAAATDGAAAPAAAGGAAAAAPSPVILRGRTIVLEEFDRLAAGIEHERREAARAAAAAARAVEEAALAAAAAEQAARAAEAGHDKHGAAGQFAGLFKQVSQAQTQQH